MENMEIAAALGEVADLLEMQEANPFRVRAYRNAVRTITGLTRPLSAMMDAGEDLTALPGIGHDIAGYIAELLGTGRLAFLADLEKQLPGSLAELMTLQGLGPKRVRRLYEELGVESLADLRRALEAGEVEALRGFGARSVEKLRQALEERTRRSRRFRLVDADQIVGPLLAYLRAAPGVERVEAAGSYRRRLETVGDIDLLAICGRPAPVMAHFTSYPDAVRIEGAGRTRGTIVLRSGLQVDLRVVPARSYGAALHYFTGSKAHNIAVRKRAVERGLRLNEYGIFRVRERGGAAAGRRVGGAREEDVFEAVGLAPVPPELREDRGEVEAAERGALPRLITLQDIRGDLQMHSRWSDGQATIDEMAEGCRARGYAYMAITDHTAAVRVAGGLSVAQVAEQAEEVARLRRRLKGLRLLRGMEVDILRDGTLDLPDEELQRLDIVVASVHSSLSLSKTRMTDRILRALEHPSVDILAHPTGRLIGKRAPYAIDLEAVLAAAARLDVAVELNAQPDRLDLDDVQVRLAREMGARVVVNTDAHTVESLDFMRYGVDQARRGWLEAGDVLNTMTLAALEHWLGRRGGHPRAARARPRRRPRRRLATAGA